MSLRHLTWLYVLLFVGSVMASEVPFVFDENSSNFANNSQSHLEKISRSTTDSVGVPPLSGLLYNEPVIDILSISRSINRSLIYNNSNNTSYSLLSSFSTISPLSINNTSVMVKNTELPPKFSVPETPSQVESDDDLFQKGNQNYDRGNYEAAIECYSKAIQLNPQLADAWYNKGNAFFKLKMYKDALNAYQKAIDINPNFVDAISNKDTVLKWIGCSNQTDIADCKRKD